MTTEVEKATKAFTEALSAAEDKLQPVLKWRVELAQIDADLPAWREQRLDLLGNAQDQEAARLAEQIAQHEGRRSDLQSLIERREAANIAARLSAWDNEGRRLSEAVDAAAQGRVHALMNELQPLYQKVQALEGRLIAAKGEAANTSAFAADSRNIRNREAFAAGSYWPAWAPAQPAPAAGPEPEPELVGA